MSNGIHNSPTPPRSGEGHTLKGTRGTALKGQCEIQLIDNVTGEVVQRTKDNNMITNAIANILNPSPLFFAEGGSYPNYMRDMVGTLDRLLGGVMLWSEPIEENVNTIYPPNILAQVGYAGNDAYTGDNSFRGSYNAIESGRTHTGFKFVWDFPSSVANGTIKCVTATSGLGGRCGWGGDMTQKMNYSVGTATNCPDKSSTIANYVPAGIFCGCLSADTYAYLKLIDSKTIELLEVKFPTYRMKTSDPSIFSNSVARNYNDCITMRITAEKDIAKYNRIDDLRYAKVIDDCIHLYNPTQKNVRITKISLVTKELISQVDVATPAIDESSAIYGAVIEHNGFLYVPANSFAQNRNVYKINVDKPTEYKTLNVPRVGLGNSTAFNVLNGQVLLSQDTINSIDQGWFIVDDEFIPCKFGLYDNLSQNQITQSTHIKAPFYLATGHPQSYPNYSSNMLVSLLLPYLATINNLATPIQKTASQSMKVVYTFTDIEEGEIV